MVRIRGIVAALLVAMVFVVPASRASDSTEVEQLKRDIEDLRRKLNGVSTSMPKSSVDKALEGKYGPNSNVVTRAGKLTISGLIQVWYYGIENSNKALFANADKDILDTNTASDNDSFRIRRTELKFHMDIHENVSAVVMIDPAREATSFPNFPSNQGNVGSMGLKTVNNVAPEYKAANDVSGSTTLVNNVQTGSGAVPRLLQDAYINYHGVVPHHDFTVGQFLPAFGEEGVRSSAQLDFAERSFIGQGANLRDLGATVHGIWWDERFQYTAGVFDGAGNYHGTAGQYQNRADDNNSKDILASALVRPIWKNEKWGSLELGGAYMFGRHGESGDTGGSRDPINNPVNGLNRPSVSAHKWAAYAAYMPGGPLKGTWFRGEYHSITDAVVAGDVIDLNALDTPQLRGQPFTRDGWYVAAGYKLSESTLCDKIPSVLKPFEFAFRYEAFDNVLIAKPSNPELLTSAFQTHVYTAGINYYIKGHNAKIQANYNMVKDPRTSYFQKVENDNFIISFQVAF